MKHWKRSKGRSDGTAVQAAVSPEFTPGMVLVKPRVDLPSFASRCVHEGLPWDVLADIDGEEMQVATRNEGWHFFYIVPAIVARAISLWRHKAIANALRRAINAVETQGVNALEIVSIRVSRIFGMSFVKIAAQPRHVRSGPFAFDLEPHRWTTWKPETSVTEVQDAESTFSLAA